LHGTHKRGEYSSPAINRNVFNYDIVFATLVDVSDWRVSSSKCAERGDVTHWMIATRVCRTDEEFKRPNEPEVACRAAYSNGHGARFHLRLIGCPRTEASISRGIKAQQNRQAIR
jgi:hypothetical protein